MPEMNTRIQEEERNFRFDVRGRWESERWEIRVKVVLRTKYEVTEHGWKAQPVVKHVTVVLPNTKEPLSMSWTMAKGLRDALEEVLR